MSDPSICLVAAPLTARSGVYRSTLELVGEARRRGLQWSALLGVSASAGGDVPAHPDWISERTAEPTGPAGILELRRLLLGEPVVARSTVLISMNPQADMALATTSRDWIAYLRGLPWPAPGESGTARRWIWGGCERVALRRAREVWATTEVLRSQVAGPRSPVELVAAGIEPVERRTDGAAASRRLVWAARFDVDKNPALFVEVLRGLDLDGVMYGTGPLRSACATQASDNVELPGWARSDALWDGCLAYVGTSTREAFGRSAIEAGMSGVPLILSTAFGAAPLLFTDPDLADRFVLPTDAPERWRAAARDLSADVGLRRAVSDHVHENASRLSIGSAVERVRARTALDARLTTVGGSP